MMRRLPFVLLLASAAAIAPAHAGDALDPDVLVLRDGERVIGELVDVQDGKYWILQANGLIRAVDFRTVARVEMAGVEPIRVGELPLPEWREGGDGRIGGGFDFGPSMGARVRFRIGTPAIDHVDLRLATSLMYTYTLGVGVFTGAEVALFGDAPVHLAFSANLGAMTTGGLYPFVGAGISLQIDPRGPFELHFGAVAGTSFSYAALSPELSASWVW